jgi:uncharacterized membrane protein
MDTWEVTFEEHNEAQQTDNGAENNGRNVGKVERIASAVGGGALIGYALKKRTVGGAALGVLGASLLYRGATGHCEAYRKLGINTASNDEDVARDVHVEKSVTINASPKELYRFWRDFENLPRFMENLKSVRDLGDNRSHWVATTAGDKEVEWDAEIYNEKEGELIAWRSLPGADVTNAGSVHFEEAPGGRGTRLKVVLNYNPPGGKATVWFAKLFGQAPGQLVEHNLRRLKQLIEAGEIPTTEGQASGREATTERHDETEQANTLAKAAAGGSSYSSERGL